MAYASPSDWRLRYDARELRDLVVDDDTPITEGEEATDPVLLAFLDDASGEIDSALLSGGRYTSDQLAGLTGTALAYLKRITCDLAMFALLMRRPGFSQETLEAAQKLRDLHLKKLASGENIFNLDENRESQTASVDGPNTADYLSLNLTRDHVRRYYPARHLPGNR